MSFPLIPDKPTSEVIADGLRDQGVVVVDDALPAGLADRLLVHLVSLRDFRPAGVGREVLHAIDPSIRSDRIHWIDPVGPETRAWFAWIEQLRLDLNRRLLLGLFDYECHYASYPPGAFYRRHYDAFRGSGNRVVSTVLYLNPEWNTGDGGELTLYRSEQAEPMMTVAPLMGRLVLFLSEEFPHEVLETCCQRRSLTGWFRINTSIGGMVDPPR